MEILKRGLVICILLISILFVHALDEETAIYNFGDNETIVGLNLGDNETFFISPSSDSLNITLISPDNASSSTSTSRTFVYNVNSSTGVSNCSLVLDGVSVSIEDNISTSESNSFYVSSLSRTSHTWKVSCINSLGTGSSEERTFTVSSASSTTTTSSSSGGGGGGGTIATPSNDISLDVSNLNLRLVLNTTTRRSVRVLNSGTSARTINFGSSGLDGVIVFNKDSLTLSQGESQEVQLVFVAPQDTGVYTGKVFIGGLEIPTSINVVTKQLLFDTLLSIADSDKYLSPGEPLNAQVTLIPMGEEPRVDVTLNYVIKDYDGKVHFSESETVLVEGQKDFKKQFNTRGLPEGKYVLGVELVYINGVATASSHFEIESKSQRLFLSASFFGVIALIFFTLGVILYLIKYKKPKKLLR